MKRGELRRMRLRVKRVERGCAELGGYYEDSEDDHITTASFSRIPPRLVDSKKSLLFSQCPGLSDSPSGSEYRSCTVRKQALISSY